MLGGGEIGRHYEVGELLLLLLQALFQNAMLWSKLGDTLVHMAVMIVVKSTNFVFFQVTPGSKLKFKNIEIWELET